MGAVTDPVADYLTRIRNASRALKETVTVRGSKLTVTMTEILKKEGFIRNFKVIEENPRKLIRIHLKYRGGKKPAIQSIVRVSKPGLRHYVPTSEIPRVLGGLGIGILSTSKGLMTDRAARTERIGGELLCKVW
ncbi:MAG: 30S ribosomal protein S8 [Omnitrophica bacterium RIFCSPHIGHO2_02_FULL_49_9]|nr:MAG: 30S ribosomal protein S8 [Omnitrophica bacterium RIFCSPHIGHO2_02_FULL_49_9]OGW88488.1 MAG: 30S ribosomal protein S8 [Omnitrophica bacterium RIFCSPLOWO2_01_FULL_50_24]